ncbi:hypothetical protein B0A48_06381 [Cryoendolithus antarcticus]|uniref:HIG1 domain-containing protein n=1 Tax=Cryoendolithus antarcticus TaxID=1507870 RepID=A0A1V8TB83_9PEZI|nr:hypothetical protein B0A48_06381 [Cryoendolithus antarcticus]
MRDFARYQWEKQAYEDADDICNALVADYACPRAVQIRAWQMKSLCTSKYFLRVEFLEKAASVNDKARVELDLPETDDMYKTYADHTMLQKLNNDWLEKWRRLDKNPPTKEQFEHDAQQADEREEDAEMEQWRADCASMDAAEEAALRGEMLLAEEETDGDINNAPPIVPSSGFMTSAELGRRRQQGLEPPAVEGDAPGMSAAESRAWDDAAWDQDEEDAEAMDLAMKAAIEHVKALREIGEMAEGWSLADEGAVEKAQQEKAGGDETVVGMESPPGSDDAPPPSSFDDDISFEESRWQKLRRKLIEEPLIPLGCALTCWALYEATKSMRSGDKHRTNRMFRRRIYAQGFTIIAMVAGSAYWENDRSKRKEFGELSEEKRKREKRDAWIRELEVRDEEEQELRKVRDRMVLGGRAERKGVSEEEARRLEKGGGAGSIRSAVERGEGNGLRGPILRAVRHLWEERG